MRRRSDDRVHPDADGDASVAILRCAGCRYDLRSARDDGRCPECGLPVADSRRRAEMRRLRDERQNALLRRIAIAAVPLIIAAFFFVQYPWITLEVIGVVVSLALAIWIAILRAPASRWPYW